MPKFVLALAVVLAAFLPQAALAQTSSETQPQDRIWIQIEAHPTLTVADTRARAYAAAFPETVGFRLGSGWYAIALGPYPVGEGAEQLVALKRENLIPSDSYIVDGSVYIEQFWPTGVDQLSGDGADMLALPDNQPEEAPEVAADPAVLPDETPAEARASELQLTSDDRKALQTALHWFGFYTNAIDGAFGPGTRNSMAAWQDAQAQEPTGILTTRQRAALVAGYQAEVDSFGFTLVDEPESGIEVTLPLELVEFDRYEPPFVQYRAKGGSGLRVVLISQPGEQSSLFGLYDILQSLEAVPLTGERSRAERSFRIRGTSATTDTTAVAQLAGGTVKGWMVVATPGNEQRDGRIIAAIETSFRSTGEQALDPGMVAMSTETRSGLVAGLEIRKPRFSRSGFFVDDTGSVLTTTEAVEGCGRITIDRTAEASVSYADAATGLAIITPSVPLSPRNVAEFQVSPHRIGSDIALSGYSYEDRLPSPVLTFGTLEDITGLNGEIGMTRLSIDALPGDSGGPVIGGSGAVLGMLLPQMRQGSRQLPPEVFFAASASSIAQTLATAGLTPLTAAQRSTLSPDDLSRAATGMTVLVSCWD